MKPGLASIPGLGLALGMAVCLLGWQPAGAGLDPRSQAREALKEMVAFPSSESNGGTADIAGWVEQQLLGGGFAPDDVQVFGPSPGNSGVLARFRGRGEASPVLLMAHLDVVEAQRSDWSMDPFSMVEKDGYFYGRGSLDNKAGAAAILVNFLRLKREGFTPARDLVLLFTGDEESNMESIRFLLQQRPEILQAEFAVNTDGGFVDLVDGKPAAFVVQAAEKVYLTFRLEATDPGGHSSMPRPDNPIYELARGLARLGDFRFPVSINEVVSDYLRKSAPGYAPEQAEAMLALADGGASAEQVELVAASEYLNALIRTTCVATQVQAGHAENALPQSAVAIVNCRILPQDSQEQVEATLRRVIASDKILISRTYDAVQSPVSPLSPVVMELFGGIAGQMYSGLPMVTQMSTGATDGQYTRNAGIPTYGVSALKVDQLDDRSHGRDERVGVEAFYESVEYWYRMMKAL